MKTSIIKTGLFFLFAGAFLFCSADYKDEIKKLARPDLLPQFQDAVAARQISSYDTTGGNDDGFSGRFSYLRKENGNSVIADIKGSGIIQRIWTPTPTEDTIQFYFDGEPVPRIELKFIDLFSGEKFPFIRPVCGNEVGGYYCYLPIPYRNSCKIVYKGERMQFIQVQYKEKKPGSVVSSFPLNFSQEENEALNSVAEIWKNNGNNGLFLNQTAQNTTKSITQSIILKPGSKLPVFSLDKGGRIVRIEITPQLQLNTQFKDLIIRARWDEEPVAAFNCPLSDFFGYAFGKPSMQSLLAGVAGGVHYCNMPMPFDKKAIIELEFIKSHLNQSTEIPVNVTVFYNEEKRGANEGKFYAEWKRSVNPPVGQPYLILDKTGRGHYVGTLLQAQGLNSGMTLFFEGDDVCTVDGEMRFHGTGSEDFFNGGWYALADRWDQAFSLPMHGCLAYSVPLAHTGGFRFYMDDKIPFEKSFHLTIEHGPEGNKIPADYTSVAFYYCDRPPVSNNLPAPGLSEKVNSPSTLEYWIQLLPVKALGFGTSIEYGKCKDEKSGNNYEVFKLKARDGGFGKFELEVPSEGKYKLYLSYLKGPEGGPFEVFQRQVPVNIALNGYASSNTFVEKELIGSLSIKEGTNTITISLKKGPGEAGLNSFLLHRIYLEKIVQ